jgi:hypothetical protein
MVSLLSKAQSRKPQLDPLFCLILGSSGSGKSSTCGSLGVPTLFFRTPVESHGAASARTISKGLFDGVDNITEIDIYEGADNADQAWDNLLSTLDDPSIAQNFGAVVIDSLTDLQPNLFAQLTDFKERTTSSNGKPNNLAIPGVHTEYFNLLINQKLKKLHSKGVHIILLAAATVVTVSDDGAEVTAKPGLSGTMPASLVNRSCPDILLINRIREEDGTWAHNFLFYPKVSKESKSLTGQVTKTEGFSMRLSHVFNLPERANARLDELIAHRKECFEGK